MDGTTSLPNLKHMTNAFQRVLIGTTGRLPPFFEENERSQEQPEGVPSSLPNQEPSHHFTTEQDLSGVPFDIYATPESYIHQTSLLDESTKAE